jgi:hypothetical protein
LAEVITNLGVEFEIEGLMPILAACLSEVSLDITVSLETLLLRFMGNNMEWGDEVEEVVG